MLTAPPAAQVFGSSFPTTRPSILQAALDQSDAVRVSAVATFYDLYRRPIVAYLRRSFRNVGVSDEEDLLQGFFLDKIIQGKLITQFKKERGRFRSLLCTALKNYVRDVCKHHNAQRRNPGTPLVEVSLAPEAQDHAPPPDHDLQVDCVRATIARALLRMRKRCVKDDRMDFWYALTRRLAAPIYGYEPLSIGQIAEDLNLPSNAAASNLLINAQRRFRTALREEIASYAWDDEEIDREIQQFFNLLSENTKHGSPG